MLDLGWTEIVVIAVVAILVVGPKDLPRMLRSFGQTLGQLRRSANEFKRQFDDALREAEREADFEDARKSVQSLNRADPLMGLKTSVEKDLNAANKAAGANKSNNGSDETAAAEKRSAGKATKPAGKAAGQKRQSTGKPAAGKAKPAGAEKSKHEPASSAGSADSPEARRDSDAA